MEYLLLTINGILCFGTYYQYRKGRKLAVSLEKEVAQVKAMQRRLMELKDELFKARRKYN